MKGLENNVFEGKDLEETINLGLKKLNASKEEVYYSYDTSVSGTLFKIKKYVVTIVLKEKVIEYIKSYLKEILDYMRISAEMEIQKREKYIKVHLISDNSSILIGKNGRTISSIETLLRQSLQSKTGTKINVILDVNEYKEKQEKNLKRLAVKMAREVIKTKVDVKLDSMNSYERRLIHNELSNFKGIYTKSEGEEPNRCVVIKAIDE